MKAQMPKNPPKCYRNRYVTPNLDPYSICLDCAFRTPCTTAILDEPDFKYETPESLRNELVKDLVEFCDGRIGGYCITLDTYEENDIRYKQLALKIDELNMMKSVIEEHGKKKGNHDEKTPVTV